MVVRPCRTTPEHLFLCSCSIRGAVGQTTTSCDLRVWDLLTESESLTRCLSTTYLLIYLLVSVLRIFNTPNPSTHRKTFLVGLPPVFWVEFREREDRRPSCMGNRHRQFIFFLKLVLLGSRRSGFRHPGTRCTRPDSEWRECTVETQ